MRSILESTVKEEARPTLVIQESNNVQVFKEGYQPLHIYRCLNSFSCLHTGGGSRKHTYILLL